MVSSPWSQSALRPFPSLTRQSKTKVKDAEQDRRKNGNFNLETWICLSCDIRTKADEGGESENVDCDMNLNVAALHGLFS